MAKHLYLMVGKSASGKTTVANELETYGFSQLWSYTTRPKRYEFETGHTFISDDEFNKLKNIIAYTEYNGNKYCCTKEQIDAADVYVLDVPGVETLLKNYTTNRMITVFYFDASVRTRIERMINRGDSDNAIISRLYNDEASDWEDDLMQVIAQYGHNNVRFVRIDANQSVDVVLDIVYKNMVA